MPLAEGVLDEAVFAAVEADNADAAAGAEAIGGDSQQFLEGGQFVIDENPQGLKGAGGRVEGAEGRLPLLFLPGLFGQALGIEDQTDELRGLRDRLDDALADDHLGDEVVVGFVGQFPQGLR